MGLLSSCGAWSSHCSGFSCCGLWALGLSGSVVMAHGLSCPKHVGSWGFPGGSVVAACQCKRCGFSHWISKTSEEVNGTSVLGGAKKQQQKKQNKKNTRIFLPGKSHGQRSLAGCSPLGCKRVRHNLVAKQLQQHVGS